MFKILKNDLRLWFRYIPIVELLLVELLSDKAESGITVSLETINSHEHHSCVAAKLNPPQIKFGAL